LGAQERGVGKMVGWERGGGVPSKHIFPAVLYKVLFISKAVTGFNFEKSCWEWFFLPFKGGVLD
jgi:hypothetical protein